MQTSKLGNSPLGHDPFNIELRSVDTCEVGRLMIIDRQLMQAKLVIESHEMGLPLCPELSPYNVGPRYLVICHPDNKEVLEHELNAWRRSCDPVPFDGVAESEAGK